MVSLQVMDAAHRPALAAYLVRQGLIEPTLIDDAVADARRRGQALVEHLLEQALIPAQQLAEAAATTFQIELVDETALTPDPDILARCRPEMLRRHRALPLRMRDGMLLLAVSDPANVAAVDEIRFHLDLPVLPVLVADDLLSRRRDAVLSSASDADHALEHASQALPIRETPHDTARQDTPVIRYVDQLLERAISEQASDIHIEPFDRHCQVRFRRDGMLHEAFEPPLAMADRLIARLKVMARMDISERRVPQDGRLQVDRGKNSRVDFRVSSLPTLHGEKLVLRLLNSTASTLAMESLGFNAAQLQAFRTAIERPHGLILVTGPTGAGKTVTLYSALQQLNTVERNVLSVEDPVEIKLSGVNQVAVNTRAGLHFATTLRAFLRQDPDVMMVGEIRDDETAEIAVKAAQTGHLVLSTLHTNDAPGAITRLANMGIPRWNIAASLTLVSAQRLARRLCPECRRPASLSDNALKAAGFDPQIQAINLYEPVGCPACVNGYNGRVGLHEMLSVTPAVAEQIVNAESEQHLLQTARADGYSSLRESGLEKAAAGLISLAEVDRVARG